MPTQPTQSVVALPLAPSVRRGLLCAGLSSVLDLQGLSEADLMQITGLPQDLAAEVVQLTQGQPAPGWKLAGAVTASEFLAQQSSKGSTGQPRGIPTGCTGLDALLGGAGVACGTVTEFYGVPGVGKTQVGMQLAVNAQCPKQLGGLGAQVLYIDTEGSFMTDRLIDLASAAVQRVQTAARSVQQTEAAAKAVQAFSVESVLSGILYMRVQHYTEQLALITVLDLLLQQQPQVSLVVLDSATFHFRQDFSDAAQRSRLMLSMAQQLAQVAEQRNVAVVMVNQVVTRITDTSGTAGVSKADITAGSSSNAVSSAGLLAPALGEGWGQAASCRVALFWEGSQRYAMVTKAKHVPLKAPGQPGHPDSLCVPYYVRPDGIC